MHQTKRHPCTHNSNRSLWVIVLLTSLVLCSGCGQIDVPVKESFSLTVDVNDIYKQNKLNTSAFPNGKIPKNFKKDFPFFLVKHIDLREKKEIKEHGDKISSIVIDKVNYRIVENSMNVDFPAKGQTLRLSVGSRTTAHQHYQAVGVVPSFPKATPNFEGPLLWNPGGKTKTEAKLTKLDFSLAIIGKLSVDGSKQSTLPKGKIELELNLEATAKLFVTVADLPEAGKIKQ